MEAIIDAREVKKAIDTLHGTFVRLGRTDHGYPNLMWIDRFGIWLKDAGRQKNGRWRYWNGFGNRLGNRNERNLIVEVNPADGGIPGRFQGLVARSGGDIWLLHRGEINTVSGRANLHDFRSIAGIDPIDVKLPDGSIRSYFKVCRTSGSDLEIAGDAAEFVNACSKVRTAVTAGPEAAEIERRAQIIDEIEGKYEIPPLPARTIERIHALVWRELRDKLRDRGAVISNERRQGLGPDLYTLDKDPHLYEIKTGKGSSDYLKGVGQLLVYEKLLGKNFKKYLVSPESLDERVADILSTHFGINVLEYRLEGDNVVFKGL